MSILIKRDNKGVHVRLTVDDLIEGNAYMNEDGVVFISCHYADIRGFSISGHELITTEYNGFFTPVDITITVHD